MKFALALLAAVTLIASQAFAEKDPEQGWTDTAADLDLVKFYTQKQYPCYANERNLLGCMQLINNLGSRLDTKVTFLTPEYKEIYPDIDYTVVTDFGDVQLVQVNGGMIRPSSVEEREIVDKRQRELLTAAATKLLAKSTDQRPDFDKEAEHLLTQLPQTISEQRAIGLAINSLLEMNDWHSHIDAVAYLIAESEASNKTGEKDAPKNLTVKVIKDMGRDVLYMKLVNFMDFNACSDMAAAIAKNSKVQGIVLDLRDNPGGMVQQVTCIGGLFVGNKTILTEKKIVDGKIAGKAVAQKGSHAQVTKKPLTILINAGSASASEILAGAMQDYKRAWIVGIRSYGKGTVQSGKAHPLDASIYWFQTTDAYLLPTGRSIQAHGVVPDFTVARDPALPSTQHFEREEDFLPYVMPADKKTWTETRPLDVAQIEQNCLAQHHASEDIFKAGPGGDFQLLKAEEILACGAKTNPILRASR